MIIEYDPATTSVQYLDMAGEDGTMPTDLAHILEPEFDFGINRTSLATILQGRKSPWVRIDVLPRNGSNIRIYAKSPFSDVKDLELAFFREFGALCAAAEANNRAALFGMYAHVSRHAELVSEIRSKKPNVSAMGIIPEWKPVVSFTGRSPIRSQHSRRS